jgi:3-hydroxyacyl-[acyl-carrier-protein] dehydratase
LRKEIKMNSYLGVDLLDLVPHRDDALVIDSVMYDPEQPNQIVASRTLVASDTEFDGHLPGNPIFPGHWQLECMAVAATALLTLKTGIMVIPALREISEMKFALPIKPGDTMEILVTLEKQRGLLGCFCGTIHVGGKLACSAKFTGICK